MLPMPYRRDGEFIAYDDLTPAERAEYDARLRRMHNATRGRDPEMLKRMMAGAVRVYPPAKES